jgi:hypothetical protein
MDLAELAHRFLHQLLRAGLPGDIGRNGHCGSTGRLDSADNLFRSLARFPIVNDDARAGFPKVFRDSASNASARAGHHNDSIFQIHDFLQILMVGHSAGSDPLDEMYCYHRAVSGIEPDRDRLTK